MKHAVDYRALKLDGIYHQNAAADLMLRIKLPAGIFSVEQAVGIADLAEQMAGGRLHLTCRGNLELHGLREERLTQVFKRLRALGLTSRGACGGAVRAVSCSVGGENFGRIRLLAEGLQRYFTGNPHFEGLPKKFKLSVENGYRGAEHLCQDLALVYLGREGERELCDLWVAGGLGRQPQEAFLLANRVPAERWLPLVEGVIRVYQKHTPAGKRLKHLLADIGEAEFRTLLAKQTQNAEPLPLSSPVADFFGADFGPGNHGWFELPITAGQLAAADLRRVARFAAEEGDGFLAVSREQNLLLSLTAEGFNQASLQKAGLLFDASSLRCRVCPGSHECSKGLVATRDLLREIELHLGEAGRGSQWAIAGCGNSCSRPQLADYGIVGVKKATDPQEQRYDLWQRSGEGFGQVLRAGLSRRELLAAVTELG